MYKLLPQLENQIFDDDICESSLNAAGRSSEFLCEAVFAGDKFQGIEAAYGKVDGVIRTITGYCGGTLKKPTYREVCEGRTGHTEAVKVIYDKRKVSYQFLCDLFWETHDPEYLNFGIDTHLRSAIFHCTEKERKQAQESKIRKQMKLNKRIVTKITPLESEFFLAENQHQKFFLQKQCRVCECLGLRSTLQFVESDTACKLNGILAIEGEIMIAELCTFLKTHKMSKQTKIACEDLVEELRINYAKGLGIMLPCDPEVMSSNDGTEKAVQAAMRQREDSHSSEFEFEKSKSGSSSKYDFEPYDSNFLVSLRH